MIFPDFFGHISGEVVGNFLMFLPFGVLHPLSKAVPAWKNTVLCAVASVLLIEIVQPVFGRAFDLNDVILNTLGSVVSASLFFAVRRVTRKRS